MPPKVKITKGQIVEAALQLVRQKGPEALNARGLAAALGCSTQPLFSNFENMEQIRLAAVAAAEQLNKEFIDREIGQGKYPPYKASGMAYIRFAKEERELFKLLYMRDRTKEVIPEDTELNQQMSELVQTNTGLGASEGELFHFEMWAFVHGIAVMMTTEFLDIDEELVSRMLTDAYQGLRQRFRLE
ncbi:MAG: TetR/AcrR family transcriptional regulator [Clostridiales bacterium]|nr:TetR/AcrR family transcriptional regulator [Clostridiales bacterium]